MFTDGKSPSGIGKSTVFLIHYKGKHSIFSFAGICCFLQQKCRHKSRNVVLGTEEVKGFAIGIYKWNMMTRNWGIMFGHVAGNGPARYCCQVLSSIVTCYQCSMKAGTLSGIYHDIRGDSIDLCLNQWRNIHTDGMQTIVRVNGH